ncbi:unnamed protein product [Brachionus calyciflorus]|uniref:Uncharacterized protein n=1 Tax=Brachionus calyciflorus TaxID=104777 RepID=A0A813UBW1_9BILA|nr:unnamed protein product [Brachionus calyciflorus]
MRRKTKISLIFLGILILIIYNKKPNSTKKSPRINSPKEFFSLNHEWTNNGDVTQYSSVIALHSDRTLTIETINYLYNEDPNNLKCILKNENNWFQLEPIEILPITLMSTARGVYNLYKVTCKLNQILDNKAKILVATIKSENFKSIQNFVNYLNFQRPNFYDATMPKKDAIINCVHMVSNLNTIRLRSLLNWIKIQKSIGYDKVKLYTYYVSDEIKERILRKNRQFVEFIDFTTNFNDTCKYAIKMRDTNPGNSVYEEIFKNCERNYKKFFEKHDFILEKIYLMRVIFTIK